jgi:hypothetical protein
LAVLTTANNSFNWTLAARVLCNILSDERMCLSFTIAADPRQRCHSRVRVPRDSWRYCTVWDPILPQPGGPVPRIYIPQEQGAQLYPPAPGSLLVASYVWRGYGGGIRSRLHTGFSSHYSIHLAFNIFTSRCLVLGPNNTLFYSCHCRP